MTNSKHVGDVIKESTRVPFDLYDFFGYIFPGSILFSAILLSLFFLGILTQQQLVRFFAEFESLNWAVEIFLLFSVFVLLYLLGHLISTTSSTVIDRMLVRATVGYPFEHLFEYYPTSRPYSSGTHKYLFILGHLLFICGIFMHLGPFFMGCFHCLLIFFGLLVALRIVSKLALNIIQDASPDLLLKIRKLLDKFTRHFYFLAKYLIDPLCKILYDMLSINRPFSAEFKSEYEQLFKNFSGLDPEKAGTENYWLCYCYIRSHSPQLDGVVRNFLHMYSFARNVCSAVYIVLIFNLLIVYFQSVPPTLYLIIWLTMLLLTALLLLVRYYYLYSSYYSKFIFRSFLTLSK